MCYYDNRRVFSRVALSNKAFCDDENDLSISVQYSSCMWLLSTGDMASRTEELTFTFNLILINSNLNSHMWFLATVQDNTAKI